MTAAEAIELLKNRTPAWLGPAMFYITERESQRIAALIEQQAQTIEALKLCWNCRHIEADRCNKHNRLVDFPMREKCDQWQVKEAQ